jgi:flagellar biosynthetic protein FliR
MIGSDELPLQHVLTFSLVLVRVTALCVVAPLFGSTRTPLKFRAAMSLTLAMLVAPLEWHKGGTLPESLGPYLVLVGAEALVGVSLGLGVLLLVSSMHVAGQAISQMSGLQMADVFDPALDTSTPVFSQVLFLTSAAIFLILGGHRHIIEALLDTFVWLPAGQGGFSRSMLEAMTSLLTQSFVLGLRAAAPVMVALLLATLILGLVSRSLPQLNVLALGFGFNAMVAIAALGVSLGGAAWLFHDQVEPLMQIVLDALRNGADHG